MLKLRITTPLVDKSQASALGVVQIDAFDLGGTCKLVLKSGVYRAVVEQLSIKIENWKHRLRRQFWLRIDEAWLIRESMELCISYHCHAPQIFLHIVELNALEIFAWVTRLYELRPSECSG